MLKKGGLSLEEVTHQKIAWHLGASPKVFAHSLELDKPDTSDYNNFGVVFYPGQILMENLDQEGYVDAEYDSEGLWAENFFSMLSRCHKEGIAHNDLHNSNVMVVPGTDKVKIVDWGLSRKNYLLALYEFLSICFSLNGSKLEPYPSNVRYNYLFSTLEIPSELFGILERNVNSIISVLKLSGEYRNFISRSTTFTDLKNQNSEYKPLINLAYQGIR